MAASIVADDDLLARFMAIVGVDRNTQYTMFYHRSHAFYVQHRDTLFRGFQGSARSLWTVLRIQCKDPVGKVALLLSMRNEPGFFDDGPYGDPAPTWESLVQTGLRHENAEVRVQFPAVAAALAGFLLRVPPRVQYRVLDNAGSWRAPQ
jgi:hypothetical protein